VPTSARVVFSHSVVVWIALGIGIAQSRPVSRGTDKAKAVELNHQGSESVGAQQFEQAKALFKQAIQLDPKLSDAYENLALILLLDGNDVAAEHTAVELLALAPGNYNARLVAGVAALNRNNFSRGRDYLVPLIRSGADDPLVTAAYAIALERSGDKAAAAKLKAKLTRLTVEAPDALLAGQIFRQPKLRVIAQAWMETSIANGGTAVNPELLHLLAARYAEQGRVTDASALYSKMLEVSPGNVDALVELSELERVLGQQEKSATHLYAAKALAATDILTLLHFSQVCMRRRMYVDARDALKKVADQDAHSQHAWYQLGLAQFRLGETQDAETDFKAALALEGNDEWSRVGLGAVLMSAGRQHEAAAEFAHVLQHNPRSAAAYYYLAQIHRADGNVPVALHELEQAVFYAKDDARPWTALGQLQLAQHDLSSAQRSLQKAIELDPQFSAAHYQMARLLKATGEQAEAAKELVLFNKYHDEENSKGIVGLVSEGKWDYPGYLPPN
jgi:tetratricopeptide (TPR) repeat protein